MAKQIHLLEQVYVPDRQSWREWLVENHKTSPGIWLLYYKKGSGKPRVSYDDAVEEALCYGWIDSTVKGIDDERFMQLFTPRKAKSTWSGLNKKRVEKLIAAGLMTAAGQACIDIAKANGFWKILDDVEALILPDDLAEAFNAVPQALAFYESLNNAEKKGILWWIVSAQRAETRVNRIQQTVEKAALNQNARFQK